MPWPPVRACGQTGEVFTWTVLPAPGPIGALTIGTTATGLALVAFGEQPEVAERAAERLGVPAHGPHRPQTALLELGVAQLQEYLAGERRVFDVPLDWSLTRGSQRRVLAALFATVGFGETVTYGELAARSELGSAYTVARGVGA